MDERLALVIGARVRAARVAKHRTQVVVAGLSGIATDYLYQIERGKKLPTLPVLIGSARPGTQRAAGQAARRTGIRFRRPAEYDRCGHAALPGPHES